MSLPSRQPIFRLVCLWALGAGLVACGSASNDSAPIASVQQASASTNQVQEEAASEHYAQASLCGPKHLYYRVDNYRLELATPAGPHTLESFELIVDADISHVTAQVKTPGMRFSLFPKAHACQPSHYFTHQKVKTLKITTDDTFSDRYPAGSDVTELFTASFIRVTNYRSGDEVPGTITQTLAQDASAPIELGLRLTTAPQFPYQSFTLEITLEDGSYFQLTTGALTFE